MTRDISAGLVASLALFGSLFAWAHPARADRPLDAAFVGLLARTSAKKHPLADAAGKLPLVVALPPGMTARDLGWQPFADGLAALRVAPSDLAGFETKHPGFVYSIWPPFHPVLDQSARLNGTTAYRSGLGANPAGPAGTGRGVVVGIVDTGIDVTHPDFRDASGHSRVAWLLDLSHAPINKHPELEAEFGCNDPMQTPCAVLSQEDLDLVLQGDTSVYQPKDVFGHGTHVASIAAGNGGVGSRFVGGAPEATLVIAGVSDGTGAVSDVDIAAGARFVFERAEQLGSLPAVVNLSLGGDFGPHDGTSPVEEALAQMVGPTFPGRAIVVAAGNSATLYEGEKPEQSLGVHSQLRVTQGVPATMQLVLPGQVGDHLLSGAAYIWMTYGATDDISISLEGPGGLAMEGVGIGTQAGSGGPDSELRAAIFNGVVGPTSLLTSDTHGAIIIWEGSWPAGGNATLKFEGEGFVDAWLETAIDNNQNGDGVYFEVATRQGTINVPATHPALIAVGCTVNRTEWTDQDGHAHDSAHTDSLTDLTPEDSTCYFSSAGPTATGVMKPEISAPGALVAAAMSKDAAPGQGQPSIFDPSPGACADKNECLVVDETHALLSGSSMSAPQVAGAVALLLERDKTLTQPEILQLLEQGARRPAGPVSLDYQLGAGALDVVGTMAAYDARTLGIVGEPDAEKSWVSLSDAYARPDSAVSITGTVEVRTKDGRLSDGFDARRLTVEVQDGGVIRQPMLRVAPGLFRFAIGAMPNTGASVMQVDVRLDGTLLGDDGTRLSGHRALPIGADRWVALGTARAYGGCAVTTQPRASGWAAGALWGIVAACRGLRWPKRRRGLNSSGALEDIA